jgi:hypothetical protein
MFFMQWIVEMKVMTLGEHDDARNSDLPIKVGYRTIVSLNEKTKEGIYY